ncbi:hypothetical protein XBLMG947_2995 [Xanthomonas bromi]|uniref:Peptidase C58 YopT-type domain-containing protein n=1 Tax=Xanthomonas bromi TaxID=56449 RepID=A0A1C3NP80_9XANT|nr:YopT-type cysteine protease domain-containing protein [Xanthomonas bromi]SBV52202.1 hypothetical protein XBLMG947_2995 [Xanthomonas bromi]
MLGKLSSAFPSPVQNHALEGTDRNTRTTGETQSSNAHASDGALASLSPRSARARKSAEPQSASPPFTHLERGRARVRLEVGLHRPGPFNRQSVDRGCASSKPLSSSDESSDGDDDSSDADIDAVFNYRVARLNNANASQSCMGFAIQWLQLRDQSHANVRMDQLDPGDALVLQQQYEDTVAPVDGGREQREAARISARRTLLRDQGLQPIGDAPIYRREELSTALREIACNGRAHLISLCFEANRGKHVRHAITASSSHGTVSLFDPNYGEFSTTSAGLRSMFEALMARYDSGLNGHLQLESMTIQRVQ